MSFGKRLTEARKKKNISQEELAKLLNTKGPVIGRYERDEMKSSIEAAAKMADLLEVSLITWLAKPMNIWISPPFPASSKYRSC